MEDRIQLRTCIRLHVLLARVSLNAYDIQVGLPETAEFNATEAVDFARDRVNDPRGRVRHESKLLQRMMKVSPLRKLFPEVVAS